MHDYIEFPGEQSLLPPGELQRTRFFSFLLPADAGSLRALCQRYLNGPSEGSLEYTPLGFVLLAFTHVERLVSANQERGVITYKDIAFWVPVRGGKTQPICLFPPFIFVDDAATMVTGREVFGLPKQLGKFQMPLRLKDLSTMSAPQFRAEVVGTLVAGGQNDWRTLVTIRQTAATESSDEVVLSSTLAKLILAPVRHAGAAIAAWLSTLTVVPVVGLKQFRDANHPSFASYRAIVEAPLSIERILTPPRFLVDSFELTLMDVASHPVAHLMGLAPGPQLVPLSVQFDATLRMDAGVVVWSAA